jgi:hypothetical protein
MLSSRWSLFKSVVPALPWLLAGAVLVCACIDGAVSSESSKRGILIEVTVQGQVTAYDGNAVGEATISFSPGSVLPVTTDGDGRYSVQLAPGTYTITVTPASGSGLEPQTISDQVITQSMELDVVLVPTGSQSISGYVTDGQGRSLSGISVTVNGPNQVSTATDSSGHYFINASPGDYTFDLAGFIPALDSSGSVDGGIRLNLNGISFQLYAAYSVTAQGNTVFNIQLPTHVLSGHVYASDGTTAVEGASLTIPSQTQWSVTPDNAPDAGPQDWRYQFAPGTLATTAADGTFHAILLQGAGSIQASAPGQATTAVPVTLMSNLDLDIRFSAPALSGHITDRDGHGLSGMIVHLNGPTSAAATTDSEGNYALSVPVGDQYHLWVEGQIVQPSSPGIDAGAPDAGVSSGGNQGYLRLDWRSPISVTGGTFNWPLPTRRLTGQVVDVNGDGVAGATVTIPVPWSIQVAGTSPDDPVPAGYGSLQNGSVVCDGEGRFALTVLTGSGSIQASAPGQVTTAIAVSVADDTDVGQIRLASSNLHGKVTDRGDAGLSGVSLVIRGPSSAFVSADPSGDYAVHVAPGDYTFDLYGQLPGTAVTTTTPPPVGGPAIDGGRRVVDGGVRPRPVTRGMSSFNMYQAYSVSVTDDTTFEIGLPVRVISGRVVDVDGFPVEQATVGVPSTYPPSWLITLPGSSPDPCQAVNGYRCYLSGSAPSGSDGSFELKVMTGSGVVQVTPLAASGLAPLGLTDFTVSDDRYLVVAMQFHTDTASAAASEGEPLTLSTPSDTGTASPDNPVVTQLTIPSASADAPVTITEEPPLAGPFPPPTGWAFITQSVNISAPTSTTGPIQITFLLDGSRLQQGQRPADVQMFRDGQLVLSCATPGVMDPTPCVSERSTAPGSDDVRFVVLTDHASVWNFGVALPAPVDGGSADVANAGTGGTSGVGSSGGSPGGVPVLPPTGAGGAGGGVTGTTADASLSSSGGSPGGGGSPGNGGAAGGAGPSSGTGGITADSGMFDGASAGSMDTAVLGLPDSGGPSAPVDAALPDAGSLPASRLDGAPTAADVPSISQSDVGAMDTGAAVDVVAIDGVATPALPDGAMTATDSSPGQKLDGGLGGPKGSDSSDGCDCNLAARSRIQAADWIAAPALLAIVFWRGWRRGRSKNRN